MNIDDTLSGRARSQGIRWLLLSTTAKKALADQLRGLLPVGEGVGECRDTSHLAALGLDLGCLLAGGRFWQARSPEAGFQEITRKFSCQARSRCAEGAADARPLVRSHQNRQMRGSSRPAVRERLGVPHEGVGWTCSGSAKRFSIHVRSTSQADIFEGEAP